MFSFKASLSFLVIEFLLGDLDLIDALSAPSYLLLSMLKFILLFIVKFTLLSPILVAFMVSFSV